jgi:hypothetical protein
LKVLSRPPRSTLLPPASLPEEHATVAINNAVWSGVDNERGMM